MLRFQPGKGVSPITAKDVKDFFEIGAKIADALDKAIKLFGK